MDHVTSSSAVPSSGTACAAAWRAFIADPAHRAMLRPEHFLLQALLRGCDWHSAFSPLVNDRKVANGGVWASGAVRALARLRAATDTRFPGAAGRLSDLLLPFGGPEAVSPETMERLIAALPSVPVYEIDAALRAAPREKRLAVWGRLLSDPVAAAAASS